MIPLATLRIRDYRVHCRGAEFDQEHLEPEQYYRTWTNEDTDAKMMEAFDTIANRDYAEVGVELFGESELERIIQEMNSEVFEESS
jgi:hypothetical protein